MDFVGWGLFQKDKQDSSGSLEAVCDPIPQPMPFPPTAVRPGSPKLDPSEVYLKSKSMYEDKREYINYIYNKTFNHGNGLKGDIVLE